MLLTEPVRWRPRRPHAEPVRTLSICLINPRFEPSYWGFDYALPLYPGNNRSTMISGSLPTVAGLCGDHNVYLHRRERRGDRLRRPRAVRHRRRDRA